VHVVEVDGAVGGTDGERLAVGGELDVGDVPAMAMAGREGGTGRGGGGLVSLTTTTAATINKQASKHASTAQQARPPTHCSESWPRWTSRRFSHLSTMKNPVILSFTPGTPMPTAMSLASGE
jgi:hypothetical protein